MPDAIVTDTATLWGAPLQAAGCSKCKSVFLLPVDRTALPCPNCFATTLTPQPARLNSAPPELCLPFALESAKAGVVLDSWLEGAWLRPDDLNPQSLRARLNKSYLPMWLVDGNVTGEWEGEAGYDYQVASSQDNYSGGQWETRKVVETRIRWEPRAGQIDRRYQNVVAPALEAHESVLQALGGYPVEKAVPYTNAALAEASVRAPDLLPEAAWPIARQQFIQLAKKDCFTAAGAQHMEHFKLDVTYRDPNWTLLLLPLYSTSYRDDDGNPVPVLVNGHSGRVWGKRRASPKKGWLWTGGIGAVALALLVLGLIVSLVGAILPPLIFVGGLILVAAFATALVAPVPILYVWRVNRSPSG